MTRHPAHDIYTYLGAHPAEQGFTFRVWAPNARAVALAGDFNDWQPRPMTRLDTGVWETAAENAKVYDAYNMWSPARTAGWSGRPIPVPSTRPPVPGQTARSTTCPDTSGGTMIGGGSGWKSRR